jgi:hypothetical protein
MSRGYELGVIGIDAASSAQSKRPGVGKTARLWSSWGELGQMGGERDAGDERWASAGADGVVGDAGGVYHTGGGETARLRSSWGVLERTSGGGGFDGEQGVSTDVTSVVSDVAGVWDTGGSGTGRLRLYWGELGG